jgi:HNH endonuclease
VLQVALWRTFLSRTEMRRSDECWPWKGPFMAKGYGVCWAGGKNWRAHRLAAFLYFGPSDAQVVMHTCDNRACVNPSHLRYATISENNMDAVKKGRQVSGHSLKTHCPKGHPYDIRQFQNGKFRQRRCSRCWPEAGTPEEKP